MDIVARGDLQRLNGRCRIDALQEYLTGSNQIGSANFAYGPDGTFRGQNRQAARTAQLSLQFEF